MAGFSYNQHQYSLNSFHLDQTVFFSNTTAATSAASCLPDHQFHRQYSHDHAFHVANNLQSPASSMSMVVDDQNNVESAGNDFLAKKRKDKQMSSLNHAQSKDTSSNRLKKQKKSNDYNQKEKKKNSNNNNNNAKNGSSSSEDGAVGYIHVRARRGQATDSHSLAERVRREKISERMKLLQAIVPGCDKVTGKALMLDEIINYVQSLQNQVEFLSMKLASVNPMLYDFGVDLDSFMLKPDENMVLPIMPSVQPNGGGGGATLAPAANDNYHHLPHLQNINPPTSNSSSSTVLMFQQYSQMPNILSSQGNGEQQLWDMQDDEQRLKRIDSHFALTNNLTPFH